MKSRAVAAQPPAIRALRAALAAVEHDRDEALLLVEEMGHQVDRANRAAVRMARAALRARRQAI